MNKQRILDEIRRTATENGGVPLGGDRFFRATGISESAWRGRYWARWSDAVREPGFTPNALNPRIAEDTQLVQLAGFIRELGRYPTVAEMRLRKRQVEAFPNHKVLERMGERHELLDRVDDYCERTKGWSDVAALCREILEALSIEVTTSGSDDLEVGYV